MLDIDDENIKNRLKLQIEFFEVNPRKSLIILQKRINLDSNDNDISDLCYNLFIGGMLCDYEYSLTIINLLVKHKDYLKNYIYRYYLLLGKSFLSRMSKDYDTAINFNEQSYDLACKIRDNELTMRPLLNLCSLYHLKGHVDVSNHYYNEAFKLIDKIKSPLYIANTFNTFGALLEHKKEYIKAKKAYEHAEKYFLKLLDYENSINYVLLLINLGGLLYELKEFDEAIPKIDRGLELCYKNNFEKYLDTSYKQISCIMAYKGDYKSAYENSIEYTKILEDNIRLQTKEEQEKENEIIEEISIISTLKENNNRLQQHLKTLSAHVDKTNESFTEKEEIFVKLNNAIKKGHLTTHYQPKVSLIDNSILGAEALVRWPQEDGTLITPSYFIDIIEEMGIIKDLSLIVIKDAFKFCRKIIENNNPNFVISINIAPYQMIHQNVVGVLEREMMIAGISPKNIEVEITERTFLNDDQRALEQIKKITDMGIKLALDDFGVGYSSLSCIMELPFNTIKIDKSLIDNVIHNQKASKIVEGIIKTMKSIDISIVVEGVETEEQSIYMKEIGCNEVQGYFHGKPVSEDDFIESYSS